MFDASFVAGLMGDYDKAIRQQQEDLSKLALRLDMNLLRRILELQREVYEQSAKWITAGEVLSRLWRGPQ